MFARDKFRIIDRRRAEASAKLAHANDNRRAERPAPATPGLTTLVGSWRQNAQTGRLEWHWSLEAISDEPEAPPSPAGRCAQDTLAVSSRAPEGGQMQLVIQLSHY